MSAVASLSSTTHRKAWSRPPINVDFQVLMFTSSGLLVRFLKVFERSGYQSVKWVRYLTKANGSYQIVCLLLTFCIDMHLTQLHDSAFEATWMSDLVKILSSVWMSARRHPSFPQ